MTRHFYIIVFNDLDATLEEEYSDSIIGNAQSIQQCTRRKVQGEKGKIVLDGPEPLHTPLKTIDWLANLDMPHSSATTRSGMRKDSLAQPSFLFPVSPYYVQASPEDLFSSWVDYDFVSSLQGSRVLVNELEEG